MALKLTGPIKINSVFIVYMIGMGCGVMSEEPLSKLNKQIIYINSDKLLVNRNNPIYDIDRKNNVTYVPDFRNNKIIIIGEDGLVIKTISTHGPHGIEIDDKESIYVASYLDNRIKKFNKNGIEVIGWDGNLQSLVNIDSPVSIDTDNNRNVYIASNNLIIKVSEDGQFIKKFDLSKVNSDKVLPHGITFHANKIYVAERKTKKLLIYNSEGEYLNDFTTNGGSGFDPLSINFYNNEFILVPNYANSSLHVFDMDGQELKIVGGKGEGYGKWLSLTNVTEDRMGNIHTVEEDTNRIQIINFKENLFRLQTHKN